MRTSTLGRTSGCAFRSAAEHAIVHLKLQLSAGFSMMKCGNHDEESPIEMARLHRRLAGPRRNSPDRRGRATEDGATARSDRNVRSEDAFVRWQDLRIDR